MFQPLYVGRYSKPWDRVLGRTTCRRLAPVPLSKSPSGRSLNSPSNWSPGPITSVGLKQQTACIPDGDFDCGKSSDSPQHPVPVPRAANSSASCSILEATQLLIYIETLLNWSEGLMLCVRYCYFVCQPTNQPTN